LNGTMQSLLILANLTNITFAEIVISENANFHSDAGNDVSKESDEKVFSDRMLEQANFHSDAGNDVSKESDEKVFSDRMLAQNNNFAKLEERVAILERDSPSCNKNSMTRNAKSTKRWLSWEHYGGANNRYRIPYCDKLV
jgi:hypothetical protein